MERRLAVYPILAVILGLAAMTAINGIEPMTRQISVKETTTDRAKEAAGVSNDTIAFEFREPPTEPYEEVMILETLAVGLTIALGIYFIAKRRFG